MGDFFFGINRWIAKWRWLALTVFAIVIVGLASIVSNIRFDDDISSLIPVNEETQRIQKVLKSITFTDKIVINIRRDQNGSVDDLTNYASELLDSLQQNQGEFIKTIQGKVEEDLIQKTFDLVYKNLPLFLEEEDYAKIEAKLGRDSIEKITEANYRTLISPAGIIAKKNIVKDPLGLSFIGLKKLQKLGFGEGFKVKNGFLVDAQEQSLLLFLTPQFGSNETNKNLPFAEKLYALQKQLNSKYNHLAHSEYFGAALSAVSNAVQIKRDIQFTVTIAMTLLIVLLMIFYRRFSLPFILFAPAIFGGLLAIAMLCLIREKISALSLGIGSVLLGVTLDYGLHILTHLREGNSVKSVYNEVAPAVLMSSLTTASAFLCLLFLKSQALQDLGLFAAMSVLGASIFALLFIPQVYRPKKTIKQSSSFIERLASFDIHKSKWAIGLLFIVSTLSVFTYQKVIFNKDIAKLNYETKALIEARERLEKLTDMGSKSIYLATYGDELQKVLQQNDRIFNTLDDLKDKNEVISLGSISSLIKSDEVQRKKINRWNEFWSNGNADTLRNNLIASGSQLGFKESTFDGFYKTLNSTFRPLQIEALADISSFNVDDYLVQDADGITVTSLVKVDASAMPKVREHFEAMPNTLLIDRQQVNESFLGNLKNDFNRLLGYSLIVVIIILFVFYRSFVLTIITALPIFLTWFLTVGIMGLLGIEFNIFNIIICSFIFGLGVDYSIFITNGLLTEYRTGERILPTNKTSIILSVLTTVAGVGVLIFAKHPVLYTISVVSLIGIVCAALSAFIVQPLLFRLFIGGNDKRPIKPRILIHSLLSFAYFDLGGLLLSLYAAIYMKINPKGGQLPQYRLHKLTSWFMKSVLYTNPMVKKRIGVPETAELSKPALLIANHSSFLDILVMGLMHPKSIYLVKDHVYFSKTIGSAARLSGAYPVSGGIENGEAHLKQKLEQGFSIIAFPEGSRSVTNKVGRFHKGAFYLADKLDLDIIPVMIHGCSEVSPKDSFIIRDGSITTRFLDRIRPKDDTYGKSYSERTKNISSYFKKQFRTFRKELESPTYWHSVILENYRYKGENLYRTVKKDVKKHSADYHHLIHNLKENARIIYLSNENCHLPHLMALDSFDRKIFAHLESTYHKSILRNSYLTNRYSKIKVFDLLGELEEIEAEVLLVNKPDFDFEQLSRKIKETIEIIIVQCPWSPKEPPFGFIIISQNDTFIWYKRNS